MPNGSGRRRWGWQQGTLGELGAEMLGTFTIVAFGCGSVAMSVAALNQSGRGKDAFLASGDWMVIAWGWGLGVMFGIYFAGGITGAHLNPAVTIAMALRRGFAWAKVLPYIGAQVFGAFLAAVIIYVNYKGAIDSLEHVKHISRGTTDSIATYSIFATFPAPYLHTWIGPFLDQVIATAFLVAIIFALTDEYNAPVKANLAPVVVGLIVFAIALSFGANAGYAINPARDFGPRMLTWIAGWKSIAFPGDYGNIDTYFWIPILGPIVGGAIGAFVYDGMIRNVLLARGATPDPEIAEQGADALDEPGGAPAEA